MDWKQQNRREFLKKSIGGVAEGTLIASGTLCSSGCEETSITPAEPVDTTLLTVSGNTVTIDTTASGYAVLAAEGGFVWADVLSRKIIVVRTGTNSVSTLSRICPHQQCPITQAPSGTIAGDSIVCPCHGSVFRIADGARTAGPAPTGVQTFPASVSGTDITIDLS